MSPKFSFSRKQTAGQQCQSHSNLKQQHHVGAA